MYVEIDRAGNKICLDVIPESHVQTNAYLQWENAGKPEGKGEEFYQKALETFKKNLIIPDGEYEKLENILLNNLATKL